MKNILMVMFTLLAATVNPAGASEAMPFAGEWSVDFERTMEESRKSPKYTPEMAERMPQVIKRTMDAMRIRFTASDLVYLIKGKEQSYPFTVVKTDAESTVLSTRIKDQDITLTLRLVDGACMNFRSSGSDDMDYYVWKRVPPAE